MNCTKEKDRYKMKTREIDTMAALDILRGSYDMEEAAGRR